MPKYKYCLCVLEYHSGTYFLLFICAQKESNSRLMHFAWGHVQWVLPTLTFSTTFCSPGGQRIFCGAHPICAQPSGIITIVEMDIWMKS